MNALRMALLSVIIFVSASRIVMADTTKLVCQQRPSSGSGWNDEQPRIVEFNEAQKFVVVHFPPTRMNEFHEKGSTQGPFPANFSNDKITFSANGFNYVLNRLTGGMSSEGGYWTCQAGKQQF